MKKILVTLIALLAIGSTAHAQGGPGQSNYPISQQATSGAPSGNCPGVNVYYLNTSTGALSTCPTPGSSWVTPSGSLPTGLSFSAPTLTVSTSGSGNGQIALSGNTSGTSTITAPATAGTATNAVAISNVITVPNGTVSAPSYQYTAGAFGSYWDAANLGIGFVVNAGAEVMELSGTGGFNSLYVGSATSIGIGSSTSSAAAGPDTKLGRTAAGVWSVNDATNNDEAGLLRWNTCKPTSAANMSVSGTAVTFCTWTLPAVAKTWAWQCSGTYSVSTSADTFSIGMNAAQAPTSETGNAQISSTLTGTLTAGSATATASGNQNILTGASVSTVTSIPFSTSGTIQASGTSGTFALTGTLTGTSPSGTVNVGTTCILY